MNVNPKTINSNLWIEKRSKCQRDMIIKKIALGIICAINFGGIGVFLTYMFLHQPIYIDMIAVTPFILGVVGALALLKAPIKESDVLPWTNTKGALARGITLLSFAPIYLTIKYLDWSHYEDAGIAQRIANEIKEQKSKETPSKNEQKKDSEGMAFVMLKYGESGKALFKYGFIQKKEDADEWKKLYQEMKKTLKAREAIFRHKDVDRAALTAQNDKQLESFSERWEALHKRISTGLPDFDCVDVHSPGTWKGWIKDKLREHLGFFPYQGTLKTQDVEVVL